MAGAAVEEGRPRRTAIVTGASRGIGFELAATLAEMGYGLTVVARKPEPLKRAAAALRERGCEVFALPADMAGDSVGEIATAHESRFGRLDVLVNNAGLGVPAALGEVTERDLDLQLDVNLRGTILLCRSCLPALGAAGAEHGCATIVNVASMAARFGFAGLSVYAAAKAGLLGFGRSLNRELGARGVKTVTLLPGYVDTTMGDYAPGAVDSAEMMSTEDIARAVRFVLELSPRCVVPEIGFARPGADY